MNKEDLAYIISKKLNIPFVKALDFLDAILDSIKDNVIKGERFRLQNFGSFEVVNRSARIGFNPHTRREIIIPECKEPVFNPGKELKELIKNEKTTL